MKTSQQIIFYTLALALNFIACNTIRANQQVENTKPFNSLTIIKAIKNKQFEIIEKSIAIDYQETFPDGEIKKAYVFDFLGNEFKKTPKKEEALWLNKIKLAINKKQPTKESLLLGAIIYKTFAWRHRGHDYAYKVPDHEMAIFKEYSGAALDILNKNEKILINDPEYYRQRIIISLGNGGTKKSAASLAEKGLKINPSYHRLYTDALVHFYPQWGGSLAEMSAFISSIKKILPQKQSDYVLGRSIYSATEMGIYKILNKESPINKDATIASLEAVYTDFPTTTNAQKTFIFSCYYSNKKSAIKYLSLSGDKFVASAVNGDPSTAEMCKDWATGKLEGFFLRLHYADKDKEPEELMIN